MGALTPILIILTLLVVLVNGATDAPNAVSSAIYAGKLKMGHAVLLCGVCNLVGVIASSLFSNRVADTVFSLIFLH